MRRSTFPTTKLNLFVVLLLTALLMAACGDSPTNTSAPTAPATAAATTVAPTAVATTAPSTTVAPVQTTTQAAATTVAPAQTTTQAAATTSVAAVPSPTRNSTTAAATSPRPTITPQPTVVRVTPALATVAPQPIRPTTTPATTTPAVSRPPADPLDKSDPLLIDLLDIYNSTTGTDTEKLDAARDFAYEIGAILDEDADEIALDLDIAEKAEVANITKKITDMGGLVDDTFEIGGTTYMLIAVPLQVFVSYKAPNNNGFLRELAGMKGLTLINLPEVDETEELRGFPQTLDSLKSLAQAVKNEGVKITGADVWHAAGFKGKGVKIGIIDSGYRFHQQLAGTALPAGFTVQDFAQKVIGEPSIESSVHGTAVSEIIYSIAPEATLLPISVAGTDAEFNDAIDYLVSQKVDIISVSMGGNADAEDGNSPISRKIEEVYKATGILFFYAAGNEGLEHYGGIFQPNDKGFHQWIAGVDRMAVGTLGGDAAKTSVILRWDQWLNGTVNPNATDFDLVIEDETGKQLGVIDGDQRSRPPRELGTLGIPAGKVLYVKVKVKDGTPLPTTPVRLHIFTTKGVIPQFSTPTTSVGTNADSRGAFAVGAVDPPGGDEIGNYSSQGPISDGRLKPDISAPGGVGSASYEKEGGSTFPGTSAATPQVSALAALIKGANPNLTGPQVVQILLENAKMPSNLPVPNPIFGYGKAFIGDLTPGALTPKGNLPPPPAATPGFNPADRLRLVKVFPEPVATPAP